jgi:prophage regulatory protein
MTKLLLRDDLIARGISYSNMHLCRLEKAGRFPKRVRPTDRTVAWVEEEIEAWLKSRIAERDMAPAPEAAA